MSEDAAIRTKIEALRSESRAYRAQTKAIETRLAKLRRRRTDSDRDELKSLVCARSALNTRASDLWFEAEELDAAHEARKLRAGTTVYLRTIPIDWVLKGFDTLTLVRIESLGSRNAVISREDGGQFPSSDMSFSAMEIIDDGGGIDNHPRWRDAAPAERARVPRAMLRRTPPQGKRDDKDG